MDKQDRQAWAAAVDGYPVSINPASVYDPWDRRESSIALAKQMYVAGTIDLEQFEWHLDQAFAA